MVDATNKATIHCSEGKELILHFVDGSIRTFKGQYMSPVLEYGGFLKFDYNDGIRVVEHNINLDNLTYYSLTDTMEE